MIEKQKNRQRRTARKIRELENKEKVEPTDEEVDKMFDDFSDKYLEKKKYQMKKKKQMNVNKSKI